MENFYSELHSLIIFIIGVFYGFLVGLIVNTRYSRNLDDRMKWVENRMSFLEKQDVVLPQWTDYVEIKDGQ